MYFLVTIIQIDVYTGTKRPALPSDFEIFHKTRETLTFKMFICYVHVFVSHIIIFYIYQCLNFHTYSYKI